MPPDPANTTPIPPDDEQALIAFLAQREIPCPRCGYNLHALSTAQCPECGEGLVLKVGARQMRYGAYLTTLVAMLLPGGLGVLLVIAFMQNGMDMFIYTDISEKLTMGGFVLSLVLSINLLILRKPFLRLKPNVQTLLAAVSVIYTVVLFTLLLSSVM